MTLTIHVHTFPNISDIQKRRTIAFFRQLAGKRGKLFLGPQDPLSLSSILRNGGTGPVSRCQIQHPYNSCHISKHSSVLSGEPNS